MLIVVQVQSFFFDLTFENVVLDFRIAENRLLNDLNIARYLLD